MPTPEKKIDVALAKTLYQEGGLSLRAVAASLGVGLSSVHEALRRAGVKLRGKAGVKAPPEPPPQQRATGLRRDDDDDPLELHRFQPAPLPGPEGMAPVAVVQHEDGRRETLRAWRTDRRDSASRLGATHFWPDDPNRAGARIEPIAGPNFDPSVYRSPPLTGIEPGANGAGIPESARSRENTDTHALTMVDIFGR